MSARMSGSPRGAMRRGSGGQRKFYEVVNPDEIQQDIHNRVISSTRRTVRSLAATRPVTPQDRSRGLFGVSGADKTGIPSKQIGGRPVRPPSAFGMGRKDFLQNLGSLPADADSEDRDRPASVAPVGRPHKLAPLAHPNGPHGSSTQPRPPSGSNPRRSSASEIIAPPQGPPTTGVPRTHSAGKRPRPRPPPQRSLSENNEDIDVPSTPASPSRPEDITSQSENTVKSAVPSATPPRPRPPSGRGPRRPTVRHGKPHRTTSAADHRVSTAQHADSASWEEISQLISQLDPEGDLKVLCTVCDKLYDAVRENPINNSRRTGAVLRGCFRLLDLRDCGVLVRVVRVILTVRPRNDMPTLIQSCRMIFKLTRNERNDSIIRNGGMVPALIEVLQENRWPTTTDTLLWCCGAMKNLTSTELGKQQFADGGAIQSLAGLLADVSLATVRSEDDEASLQHTGSMLVQAMAVLRNLSDSKYRSLFLESNLIRHLCNLFDSFGDDSEFMLNSSRVLSKLTLDESCRNELASIPNITHMLIKLTVTHKEQLPLALRLLFTIGNMTASDPDVSGKLYNSTNNLETLFDLLDDFIKIDSTSLSTVINEENDAEGVEASLPVPESEDVLTKLVRVLANLCINPDIGPHLAGNERVYSLVTLLETKDVERSPELVLNLVGAINNISFYRTEDNVILTRRIEIAELIIPLLRNESLEVMIETARVFGNFSQDRSVRELLRRTRADELMVILLDHDNREVVYTVCGVLMNLMGDNEGRSVLREAGGVRSLVEVLAHVGPSDWQLAAMVCKTFWNFSEGATGTSYIEFFGDQESEQLMVTLEHHLALGPKLQEESPIEFSIWQEEFCNVAQHLLSRLTSY